MNYIELINQFWQTRHRVRLTSAEADLYFCLLQECNLRGWLNPFECPNGLICATIGVSESTLIDVRNRLQQKGFIKFVSGCRKAKSPVYSILYFENPSINPSISRGINPSINLSKEDDTPIYRSLSNDKDGLKQKQKHIPPDCPPAGDGELPLGIVSEDPLKKRAEICKRVRETYHRHCKGLPPIRTMTPKRQQAIMARMQEHGEAAVMEMLEIAGRSKFLAGQNTHQWTATFDWLFKPTNFIKTLERNYDDKTKQYDNGRTTAGGDQRKCFTGEYSEAF